MPARNRRLPRDLSWPLTTSDIRAALGEQGADVADVRFVDQPRSDGTLLEVEWIPPISSNYGSGIHPSLWCSVSIRVAPLPSTGRAAARGILREHALPELAAWISAARRAPEAWTLTRRSRSWRTAGSTAICTDDRQPYR
ncbi:hypothetical protein PYK79_19245 [Streptomyces sp. ID05-04B]|uniref:hypothetical protein n=1 Tax=unclassified Streptomyces TaxID=2593676 RepID=UPI000D1A9104|nr:MULTISPECIES: hypothetical protein [unclassified Streptomyces]AVV47138.1 hypothetical protein C6376_43270 [Streptomyces sp. P3]MDX5565022.1 hypothetical protein [Streptomyces sp. ID05-04B]